MGKVKTKEIKRLRKEKHMSQTELAEKAKIGQCFISKIEGGTLEPSIQTLARIAKALGTDYKELLK